VTALLLDTSAAVSLIRDRPVSARGRFRDVLASGGDVGIGSVAVFELWYGVHRSSRIRENTDRLRAFLSGPVRVVDLDDADAAAAGRLRARLAAAGTPIGPYDLQIAAQALRRGVPLVTGNVGEFSRVDGLRLEDWSGSP
jgi:tRNA(fMet)-specific endonuclease VapC